jgi:hypothetical protein
MVCIVATDHAMDRTGTAAARTPPSLRLASSGEREGAAAAAAPLSLSLSLSLDEREKRRRKREKRPLSLSSLLSPPHPQRREGGGGGRGPPATVCGTASRPCYGLHQPPRGEATRAQRPWPSARHGAGTMAWPARPAADLSMVPADHAMVCWARPWPSATAQGPRHGPQSWGR